MPLFPGDVAVAVRLVAPDAARLHPAERIGTARFAPGRLREFAAGRECARRALAAFGVADAAIPRSPSGAPCWPRGFVGSIAHTAGFIAAAVGRSERFASLGLDAERIHPVPDALWRALFTAEERRRLRAIEPPLRARAACVIFAAKEAFFKAQYPLTRRALGFTDVHVAAEFDDSGDVCGTSAERDFTVAPRVDLTPLNATAVYGRYRLDATRVLAGIALPAAR